MTSILPDYTDESASTNQIVPNSLRPTRKYILNKQWAISTYQYVHLFDKHRFPGEFRYIILTACVYIY